MLSASPYSYEQALALDAHFHSLTRGLAVSMGMTYEDQEDMKMAAWVTFLRTGTLKYVRAAANEEARRLKWDQKSHAAGVWKAPKRIFYSLEQLEEENGEYWWRANKQEAA